MTLVRLNWFVIFSAHRRSFSILRKVVPEYAHKNELRSHIVLPMRSSFFEPSRRGWEYPNPPSKRSIGEHIIRGSKMFVGECKLWGEEVREKFLGDSKFYHHGDTDVFFRLNTEEALKKWVISSDRENNEGHSECHFIINNNGKGLFYGNIDTIVPKDGRVKRTGFCTIRSKILVKSFQRKARYDWEPFTHLEFRVKGDGRNYAILLGLGHSYDLLWLDVFQYVLFTRGGPYWETIRVPFSKFYRTSKGRIQDRQEAVPKDFINSVGLSVSQIPGPFRLEIDYIGLHVDNNETEIFAYEMYKYPKDMVSN